MARTAGRGLTVPRLIVSRRARRRRRSLARRRLPHLRAPARRDLPAAPPGRSPRAHGAHGVRAGGSGRLDRLLLVDVPCRPGRADGAGHVRGQRRRPRPAADLPRARAGSRRQRAAPRVPGGVQPAALLRPRRRPTMSDPFIGEIRMFGGNFAPVGWLLCQGQTLPIALYDTLFNLIGTTYGGDGQETFQLPNLQSRLPVHQGSGYVLGQTGGAEAVTLAPQQMPVHSHQATAATSGAGAAGPTGNVWRDFGRPVY